MDEPLDIVVEATYAIRGRGTVTTGTIRSGVLRMSDSVEVVRPDGASIVALVRGIEFICGPNVRRDAVGFMLEQVADPYLVTGSIVRLPTTASTDSAKP